jgi:methionyl-tRNA formyltransferase
VTKPTRVVVLSSQRVGFASYCLPALLASPRIEVAAVLFSEGVTRKSWQKRWRKLKKTLDIGVLGALNGVRMRRWYQLDDRLRLEPLDELAARSGVPFKVTASLFDQRAAELCRSASADVGLSLGNGYIPERVFSAPRLGTINIHHEMLPAFQGAQSVIWQLHQGSSTTGFTIHKIDRRIDTGEILYQQEVGIAFGATLEETVRETYARLWQTSRDALVRVCENLDEFQSRSRPQGVGRSFTTPSWWQFRRISKNHARLIQRSSSTFRR